MNQPDQQMSCHSTNTLYRIYSSSAFKEPNIFFLLNPNLMQLKNEVNISIINQFLISPITFKKKEFNSNSFISCFKLKHKSIETKACKRSRTEFSKRYWIAIQRVVRSQQLFVLTRSEVCWQILYLLLHLHPKQ